MISQYVLVLFRVRFTLLMDSTNQLSKYALATALAALLEATSAQNDNLIIPIYMWSLLSLFSV